MRRDHRRASRCAALLALAAFAGPTAAQTQPAVEPIIQVVYPSADPKPSEQPPVEQPRPTEPPPATLAPPSAPGLVVEALAPALATVGVPLRVEVIVRNPGPAPVYQVRVETELPEGAQYVGGEPRAELPGGRLSWSLGILDGGAEKRLVAELKPGAEGELRGRTTATFVAAGEWRTRVTRPKLALTVTGPESARTGEAVPFDVHLSNHGSAPVTSLVLRGRLPDGLEHPQGPFLEADLSDLPPGGSKVITLRATARKTGPQTVEVQAVADGGLEVAGRCVVRVGEPRLTVKQSVVSSCQLHSEVGFELQVGNPGSSPTEAVRVQEQLPEGLEFGSASDGGAFDAAARAVAWSLDPIGPGGHRSLTLRCKAVRVGSWVVPAAARDARGLEAKCESALAVQGIPALSFEVIDQSDPIAVGGTGTYELRVLNQGSCPCSNVQLATYVPDGLIARDASGPSGYSIRGRQVVFEPLPQLAVKADALYRIRVQAALPGDLRFKAQLTCDQLARPVVKEEATRVYRE